MMLVVQFGKFFILLPQMRNHNYGLDKKCFFIDTIFADEGPKLKRIRPRAQGRAYKILKPTLSYYSNFENQFINT